VTEVCSSLPLEYIVPAWFDHSSVDLTLDPYAHGTSNMQRHAADAVEAKIASAEQPTAAPPVASSRIASATQTHPPMRNDAIAARKAHRKRSRP
jgi:hypothetical protein